MDYIIQKLNELTSYFYDMYLETQGWISPFNFISTPLWYVTHAFSWLAVFFSDHFSWLLTLAAQVGDMLSWNTIWSYILSYVPNLEGIRDWFYYWWDYVTQVIDSWWLSASLIVQGWIDAAKDWAWLWITYLDTWLGNLQVTWDAFALKIPTIDQVIYWWSNWTGNVSSVINNWWTGALAEVQDLINSAFIIRTDFWAGWQDWRDKVIEFFTDPEDWLYKSADRIVERFW